MALIRSLPLEYGINFIGRRGLFLAFSAFLMLGSIGLFFTQGLNFGVDFRGGILMELRTEGPADLKALRERVSGLGLGEVTLQEFGEPTDVLINIERQEGAEDEQIKAIQLVREAFGEGVEIRRQEFVGPKVGGELKQAGMLATVLALLGIGLYIWFRFEWHFSLAALIALAHDVVATIGFYALTQIEFNLATLAAVLTIAGYSINDTVVIFDRVRETLRKYKKLPLGQVLNRSINLTLSRTVLTSVTTLLALGALFFFGGEVIRGFTAGLIWGVVIGTYSSVGLAVPVLTFMKLRRGGEEDDAEAKGTPAKAS
ncbi:protein translocase subunit SecF [Pelagibius litoralis]|uniref:Protein-export membrane protein SecF n=1 Tax=Pelagibius litoralis TaxID=374515 RepID=A0A967C730_9PROT|nr:protein translocase subunit SecF [Pelagibius litoralis]NIA67552.1 protein translocase subunit SecF [Pelagibius litoralis]